jgi:hypothetical protein
MAKHVSYSRVSRQPLIVEVKRRARPAGVENQMFRAPEPRGKAGALRSRAIKSW